MNVITSVTTTDATVREYLTAARTYYVRTDGSDSNDGLTNTSAGAFLTIQHAVNIVSTTLDINSQTVIIQVADGAYNAPVVLNSYVGIGPITLHGNISVPTNVTISTSATFAIQVIAGLWVIQGFSLSTTGGSFDTLYCDGPCYVRFNAINFAASTRCHINCWSGAVVLVAGNYTISGGGFAHFFVGPISRIGLANATVTISGTPNFSVAFVQAFNAGTIDLTAMTFSGAATGKRYDATLNGVINTNGGGANFFPGNAAGTTASGGQYA